ncbi:MULTISPECIES: hypothetical protein [unclassified Sphingomonas]|uniref:hypothetical protein n=1 Tax=unclassified Sphingomonas TaxID=196159 RepID=UPI002269BB1B|nr:MULTISPECIES: hypothetical protein [unclassified Sphingomonas]
MTKVRTPLTSADAMTRVAGLLGWAEVSRIARRTNRCVRNWSDPDHGASAPIDTARNLEVAYRAAGGDGSPFLEAFAHQVEQQLAAATACQTALIADCADVSRETGEAVAFSLVLAQPGASPRDALRALAEAEQAETKIRGLVRRISSFLPAVTGSVAGKAGGPNQ